MNQSDDNLSQKPNFELKQFVSKDGKYWVLKFVTTYVMPVKYMQKTLENHKKGQTQQTLPGLEKKS